MEAMRKKGFITKMMPDSGILPCAGALEQRYRQFFRSLTIILLVLVLVPMSVIALLSYSQYKQLLEEEEVSRLLLNAEQAENSVARFIVKLKAIINFAGHDDRYHELLQFGALQQLFLRLQRSYPDFTDIEVISPEGKTVAYQGNYVDKPRDYTYEPWYQQVLKKGFYISSLFQGHRGVPHFVIAIARKIPQKDESSPPGYWVMRVNIDGNTLQRYVESTGAIAADDIFLIDQKNIVQTTPRKYGERGKPSPYSAGGKLSAPMAAVVAAHKKALASDIAINIQQIPGMNNNDLQVLQATVPISGSPWQLVMIKEFYTYSAHWQGFRNRLLFYFICCGGLAVIVIIFISRAITSHIHENEGKRQRLLLEAEHSNKLASIGRLAAGVAHEINNPLAIINQKAGLMDDYMEMTGDFDYKDEITKALAGIDQSVDRCKTITHRLLGFARHADIEEEEIVINTLLQDVVAFVEREATYSQIEIIFSLADDLPRIFSDRGQLQQVFLNILNNAIDAINSDKNKQENGGTINIITNATDIVAEKGESSRGVEIRIRDNGSGMSKETLKHLFEPFYTTKKAGKGTGLGLSISYGIIKKLGGNIEVASQPGEGAQFTFTLPINRHGAIAASHNKA